MENMKMSSTMSAKLILIVYNSAEVVSVNNMLVV